MTLHVRGNPPHRPRYNPWSHAARLDLRLVFRILPGDMRAYFHFPSRTIALDRRLTQVQRRCALAHELVHLHRGDVPCATSWHTRRQESHADEIAARRLIWLEDLVDAVALFDHEVDRADHLWVDDRTLRVRLATLGADETEHLRARAADAVA